MPSSRGSSYPEIQPTSLVSPALAGRFFPLAQPGNPPLYTGLVCSVACHVRLFATLWSVDQAPLSIGSSRKNSGDSYWRSIFLILLKNTGVGCHALLQGIFPIQGLNPCLQCLLNCKWILYPPSNLGSLLYAIYLWSNHLTTVLLGFSTYLMGRFIHSIALVLQWEINVKISVKL